MNYRAEIDGLRAISVLVVILFHAGIESLAGGFVGVDVFFVISGYLITTQIVDELDAGNFSLLNFYARRARRILPALFFVTLCCVPVAWVLLLPTEMREFGWSMISAATFWSNLYFSAQTGYFDTAAELKPLLHTWSLAVEEQYYIIFPLMLMFLWRLGIRWMISVLVLLFAVSLSMSSDSFYLLSSRGWELLVGVFCALHLRFLSTRFPMPVKNTASILGLGLILVSVLSFGYFAPSPGAYILIPTIGAALIILFSDEKTVIYKVLGSKPLVLVGLISYSAYLWHYPILVFARHYYLGNPTTVQLLVFCCISLFIAYLSWRFVESPFRSRRGIVGSHRKLFQVSLMGGLAVCLIGWALSIDKIDDYRLSPEVMEIASISEEQEPLRRYCHFHPDVQFDPERLSANCQTVAEDERRRVMLIGDSHSLAISNQVQKQLADYGVTSTAISYTECIGVEGFHLAGRPDHQCSEFARLAIQGASLYDVDTLIFTSRLPLYVHAEWFDNGEGGKEQPGIAPVVVDRVGFEPVERGASSMQRKTRVLEGYVEQLVALSGQYQIVQVLPIPEVGWQVPQRMARLSMIGAEEKGLTTSYQKYLERAGAINGLMSSIESDQIVLVRSDNIFCANQERCEASLNNLPLYRDDDHLADRTGARLLAGYVVEAVLSFDPATSEIEAH